MTVFPKGMNSGIAAELLERDQLSYSSNGTVRGTYITHRPPLADLTLEFLTPDIEAAFEHGLWQGACWAQPSSTPEALVCQIAGRLYFIEVNGSTGTVNDVTIPGDPNPATNPQAWLFQAEKWVIINDGESDPIFLDLDSKTARRSQTVNRTTSHATINANFVIPVTGNNVTVTFSAPTGLANGQIVNVWGVGQFSVANNAGDPSIVLTNVNALPIGGTVVAPATVTWSNGISELPAGRMGVYWRGRIWLCLTDGIQFIAGDIVGGPSGTLANNFVDAILKVSENLYLAGGGNFRIPGTSDRIQAMVPTAILDASQGQGPLAIITTYLVFSVNATVDRLTWQNLQNPILTTSLIANGGQGQNSSIPSNGDTLFRSVDGLRSLILGRREFDTWGNTPISREMNRIYPLDNLQLLPFGSAVVFDNRFLDTASPIASPQGVYHSGIVALNFDPISSLAGKAPSAYDGAWRGLNTLQLVTGYFNKLQRAFAFHLNISSAPNRIEVKEILTTPPDVLNENVVVTPAQIYDYGANPIDWTLETPIFFKPQDPRRSPYMQLIDGECAVDLLVGQVNFQVFYKPDQYPCWVPWFSWQECATIGQNAQPQFRPRMGFGRPDITACDPITNRPLAEGYHFQIKMIIIGHVRIREIRLKAVVVPQPKFMPPNCQAICPPA